MRMFSVMWSSGVWVWGFLNYNQWKLGSGEERTMRIDVFVILYVMIPWICCCSVAKSCPTLCDPMNCSMPGFPVLHYFPVFAQTHVHWVSDAIHAISSSVTPFSSFPQSFLASGSSPMSWLYTSGGQTVGPSASSLDLPLNSQVDVL